MISDAEKNQELIMSGLPDLKLRISREVRENAAFELKARRENIELSDLELAHQAGTTLLLDIRKQMADTVEDLIGLKDLRQALTQMSAAPLTPDQPTGDTAVQSLEVAALDGNDTRVQSPEPPQTPEPETPGTNQAETGQALSDAPVTPEQA